MNMSFLFQYYSWENLKGEDHLDDLGFDERIILKWNLKTWLWRVLT